jgi:Protein of unknown function (DUF4229)
VEEDAYAGPVKEFAVYTVMRLGLFLGALAIVLGVWWAATGAGTVTEGQFLISMVIAFIASGIASFKLLDRFRVPLAQKVEARAQRATARFEEMRAKEDQ